MNSNEATETAVETLYGQVLARSREGDLGGTARLCEEVLKLKASHASALHLLDLLGVKAHQRGQDPVAVEFIKAASETNGGRRGLSPTRHWGSRFTCWLDR
jgi:hypothetical protein